MLRVFAGIFVGALLGTVSGLVPGIHSNTIAGFSAALSVPLLSFFGAEGVCAMIVSMMIVHTFLDAVPSAFFGVPDADTVLSVLPAHRMYISGLGEEAVRVSALGSLYGFVLCLPLFLIFVLILPSFQGIIDWGIGLVIVIAAGLLIVFSKTPVWAFLVFAVSGALGIYSMEFSYLASGILGCGEVLLPLLTGLFGIPVLINSVKSRAENYPQKFNGVLIDRAQLLLNSVKGVIAGAIVGWLPGFSSGSANALLTLRRGGNFEKGDPRDYLISTSAANTANAVLGIAALYAVGRVRSGSMAAIADFELPPILLILLSAGIAALLGYLFTVFASEKGISVISRINQRYISIAILVFLVVLSFVLCGVFGIVILIAAVFVGLIPMFLDIPRIYCMGAIMMPIVFYTLSVI